MSMDRRNELLSVAKENQMVIIEDDYEAEINFQKKPHPSLLKSLDKDNNVIYVGSFSKGDFLASRPKAWIYGSTRELHKRG